MKRILLIVVLLMQISHSSYASNNAQQELENKITEIDSLLTLEYRSNVDIDASNLINELQASLKAATDIYSWCTYAKNIIYLQDNYITYKSRQIEQEKLIYKHLSNTGEALFTQDLPKWECADSSYFSTKYLLVQYVKQINESIVNIEDEFSYIISDLKILPPRKIDNIIDILQNKLTADNKNSFIKKAGENDKLIDYYNTAAQIILIDFEKYNLSLFFSEQQQEYINTLKEQIEIYGTFIQ